MRVSPIVNSFSSGELSPRLMGRTDSDKYTSGAEVMENFLPLPHGGALRRGGTKHIAEVKTSTQEQRLIPFEFSIDQTYDLEIGNQYIRFYTESSGEYGQVQSGGSAYEITSPWLESEVDGIQYAQNADVMWLVHPNHPPQRLIRNNHTSWSLAAEVYGFTALNEVNPDDTKTLAFTQQLTGRLQHTPQLTATLLLLCSMSSVCGTQGLMQSLSLCGVVKQAYIITLRLALTPTNHCFIPLHLIELTVLSGLLLQR
mgnify:CR=1 FL=1